MYAKAIDVVYGHAGLLEDTQEMSRHSTSEETKGLITAGMSWGDSWETLEQFSLLNILGITSDEEYKVRYFDEEEE